MTFNNVTEHSNPIFARLEFLKIENIRQLQLLSFVYDCLNKTFIFMITLSHALNFIILILD